MFYETRAMWQDAEICNALEKFVSQTLLLIMLYIFYGLVINISIHYGKFVGFMVDNHGFELGSGIPDPFPI